MPIFDVECRKCGRVGETMSLNSGEALECPACGASDVLKRISATSTLTGRTPRAYPGAGDTACCGAPPDRARCSGPGSCCGKTR